MNARRSCRVEPSQQTVQCLRFRRPALLACLARTMVFLFVASMALTVG
jgi:hypothetical protein